MIRSALNAVSEQSDDRDIATNINGFFDDFEYNVYTNRFAQIDKRILLLIIRKFKRLFEIWDENMIFSKFLEEDSFREIFTLMHNVFGDNSNKCSTINCYLECELCGEEIVLRNNDPEYSYRLHETSKYHLEFINNLKIIRNKEVDSLFNQTTTDEGIFFECHLCLISIPITGRDDNRVIESHQQDEKHRVNMEIYSSNKSHITVYNAEEKLYACSTCEEIYHVDLLMDHLRNSKHQENLSKERVPKKNTEKNGSNLVQKADFEAFKMNMKLIRVVDDLIQCVLCETNLNSVDMLVEHLIGKQHTKKLEKIMSRVSNNIQKCRHPIVNDVPAAEFTPKKTYGTRYFYICSLFFVAISTVLMIFS